MFDVLTHRDPMFGFCWIHSTVKRNFNYFYFRPQWIIVTWYNIRLALLLCTWLIKLQWKIDIFETINPMIIIIQWFCQENETEKFVNKKYNEMKPITWNSVILLESTIDLCLTKHGYNIFTCAVIMKTCWMSKSIPILRKFCQFIFVFFLFIFCYTNSKCWSGSAYRICYVAEHTSREERNQ